MWILYSLSIFQRPASVNRAAHMRQEVAQETSSGRGGKGSLALPGSRARRGRGGARRHQRARSRKCCGRPRRASRRHVWSPGGGSVAGETPRGPGWQGAGESGPGRARQVLFLQPRMGGPRRPGLAPCCLCTGWAVFAWTASSESPAPSWGALTPLSYPATQPLWGRLGRGIKPDLEVTSLTICLSPGGHLGKALPPLAPGEWESDSWRRVMGGSGPHSGNPWDRPPPLPSLCLFISDLGS